MAESAMPPTDLESPPDSPPANSLEYVRASAPVTRRQFRLLLLLTLINTIFLACFVAGPAASQFIRTQWQGIQHRLQVRKAQQQQNALLQQAAAFTEPADKIVYEEDPTQAAKLSSSSPDYQQLTASDSFRHEIRPAFRKLPSIPVQLHSATTEPAEINERLLLLHSLKNSKGESRLVWISLLTSELVHSNTADQTPDSSKFSIVRTHLLKAYLIQQIPGTGPLTSLDAKLLSTLEIRSARFTTSFTYPKPNVTRIDVQHGSSLRAYAAQIDPADPSHFTIDYAIDGQRNTIDGYLKSNDKIDFNPRAGRIIPVTGSPQVFWDPLAAPTTRPSK
jgi:hypothetical protein